MQKSAPNGFIEQPIYNNLQGELDQSGLEEASCSEATESKNLAESDYDSTFSGHKDVLDKLRQPIAQAFNLSETQKNEMKMKEFIIYCDILISRKKAGLPDFSNFTDQMWH